MNRLSVVIITYNEERNIGRCLQSVSGIADEVVVVDSFSTDGTADLCRAAGAVFIQRAWEGYSAAKNFAAGQARHDWILSLDADEALSETLRASLAELKAAGLQFAEFSRLTNYCGTWIRHSGWYPDVKLRLYDRRLASWQGGIHERLVSAAPVSARRLRGDLLHYSYYTAEEHYRQIEKYTDIAAQELVAKGTRIGRATRFAAPVVSFIRNYFLKLGILDGAAGFAICRRSAYATYLKYSKALRLSSAP